MTRGSRRSDGPAPPAPGARGAVRAGLAVMAALLTAGALITAVLAAVALTTAAPPTAVPAAAVPAAAVPPPGRAAAGPVRVAAADRPVVAVPLSRSAAGLPARLVLSAGSQGGLPVPGHEYQFYVSVSSPDGPAWAIGLHIWFTPGLIMTGPVPSGCFPVPGGLNCGYPGLGRGQSISLPLGTLVANGLDPGNLVGVSAVVHYDLILSQYASVARQVVKPPPPPTSPPPPSSPPPSSPPPSRRPPPPPHRTKPAAPVHRPASPSPSPSPTPTPTHHHHKPRPHPVPAPSVFLPMARAETRPIGPPPPVIPLGVLVTVILTPCVAAAATRFGRTKR